jgi:hypothetical protein
LALTFGRLRRSGALPARLVSRARDATGIAQAPVFALTFHNSRSEPRFCMD